MSRPAPAIDPDRLLADLHTLRGFGTYKTGVHRPTYTQEDMEARRWLASRLREAGLEPAIDGIGNVVGTGAGEGPRFLLGSHLETQLYAGWLDGALGVIYALEVARSRAESGLAGVDVGAWADEEGHYLNFGGSRSFIGDLGEAEIAAARNKVDGTPLPEALTAAGLERRERLLCPAGRYRGYLEAHIEQGDELQAKGLRLGIVTGIVGIWQYRIRFDGVQNHAGTTRMAARHDAGLALARLVLAIDRRFREVAGPRSVWTVGQIALEPGAPNIVPGAASMLFQFRDVDAEVLARLHATLAELVAEADQGPCRAHLDLLEQAAPQRMDPAFRAAFEQAAERHAPGCHQHMPSGAGHDAQIFARVMPAGMLFVPSIGGISHHWAEDTAEDDIVLGARVFAAAVDSLLAA